MIPDEDPFTKIGVFAMKHWRRLIAVGLIVFTLGFTFGSVNKARNEGITREAALNAQYLDNQNELSSFVSTFYEQLGIADRKSDKLESILVEAVKGRYEGETSAQPGGGALFSAISEAYPDLSALDTYDKVADTISAGREAYKNKQSKLLDMLRSYDTWRKKGLVHSKVVSAAGFPSSGLQARIGDKVTTGSEALDHMYRIVLASQAAEAYETGTLEPLDANGIDK